MSPAAAPLKCNAIERWAHLRVERGFVSRSEAQPLMREHDIGAANSKEAAS
jgi:hypothetical protein